MKVLFQPIYVTTPHFETELELMEEHLLKGDEVFVLQCKGELKTCFFNFKHIKSLCYICQQQFKNGINLLGKKVNIIYYPLKNKAGYDNIPTIFEDIDQLKKFKLGHAELGVCTASSLISTLNREHLLDTHQYKDVISREINNAYYVYLSFKEVLTQIKPDLVYLFNGRFSTVLPALNACEELHITYKTHERGGRIGYYTLFDNTIPHDIDNISHEIMEYGKAVPEEQNIIEGKRFFEDRRQRVEHSWKSFTKQQQFGVMPEGFDQSKKNYTFFNSTIEEYAAIRCWEKPINVYDDEIAAFCQIVEAFLHLYQYHFYLRVHPNLAGFDNSQNKRIKALENKYSNLTIIPAESKIDTYALIEHSEAVITFGSTVGVEACYWGKASILLGKALYQNLDCCYIPNSHEDVVNLLSQEKLPPKSKKGALLYGNWDLNRGSKFKHFHHTELNTGTFKGQTISMNFAQKLRWFIIRGTEKIIEPKFLKCFFNLDSLPHIAFHVTLF